MLCYGFVSSFATFFLWLILSCQTSFKVQNEQCQEIIQTDDQKWIKATNNGEWDTHTVSTWSHFWRTVSYYCLDVLHRLRVLV